ncbi:hypothetical protein [Streptomyces sp. S1D4-14]|uniref:hypothetical protein n=1 Tax=Streptomyces sp. S1D4-14 TaxID=2594461 RepID=UPI001162C73C|nr:hypothetical protein [Streptomyces sp. S1D4-14]QDN64380.1 hypothetical protein FNV66_00670 [Streptomyces sp. S1D4-14]
MSDHAPRLRGYALFNVPERIVSYVLPWVITVAVWPLAAVLHLVIGDNPLWVALMALGFVYLAYSAWKNWAVRRKETRNMVMAFTVALLTWTLFAVAVKPWQADIVKAWAIGGLVMSVAWCIRHAALSGVRDVDKSQASEVTDGLLTKVRAFKDAKVGKVTQSEQELRARVHLDPPNSSKDAQDVKDQIASVAGVDAADVKVLKVKGDASQVDVVFTRSQGASKPVVWTGPRHPGKSIADAPIWLGQRTDGSDIDWWIVGSDDEKNPRPLAHTKCTGMTGAGKTETICTAILQMRERVDIVPVVGDPAKFQQSFGDIEEVLGLAAKTREHTEQLVRNLIPLIEYRAGLFGVLPRSDGGKGYKQWVPELYTRHGIPAIFLDIEEATDVLPVVDEEADEALRKLRSVGVHFCASAQTMPHDNIPRKTRGQFAQSLAHGQKEYQDARYSLEAETLEAGADPTKWANNAPGSLYAEVTGTDKGHWPIDGRAPRVKATDREEMIRVTRPFWAELDKGSYEILSAGIVDEGAVEADEEDDVDRDFAEVSGVSLSSVDGIDVGEPLASPRGRSPLVTFAEPLVSRMTTEDARAEMLNRIGILASGEATEVTFEALQDLPTLVGRSRVWVYDELERLEEIGVLRRLTPPNTRAAVYEITGSVYEEAAAVG